MLWLYVVTYVVTDYSDYMHCFVCCLLSLLLITDNHHKLHTIITIQETKYIYTARVWRCWLLEVGDGPIFAISEYLLYTTNLNIRSHSFTPIFLPFIIADTALQMLKIGLVLSLHLGRMQYLLPVPLQSWYTVREWEQNKKTCLSEGLYCFKIPNTSIGIAGYHISVTLY